MPAPIPQSGGERPLGRLERLFLVLFAATVMLLCHAFAITSLALLCALLALEFLLVLVAARFGLAVFAARFMEGHLGLAAVFFCCIRLPRGPDLGFSLERHLLEQILTAIDSRMTSHTHRVQWRNAPSDYQPAGPVRPGVEGLIS